MYDTHMTVYFCEEDSMEGCGSDFRSLMRNEKQRGAKVIPPYPGSGVDVFFVFTSVIVE
jgi:hypothetical protein